MKRFLLLVLMAAMLISAANIHLVRFTTINKSGYDAIVTLEGKGADYVVSLAENDKLRAFYKSAIIPQEFYYLTIPAGTHDQPEFRVWTIMPNLYQIEVTYVNYGQVISSKAELLTIVGNTRLNLLPPAKPGELQCVELYDEQPQLLRNCLENLYQFKYLNDHQLKYLPTSWLSLLKY